MEFSFRIPYWVIVYASNDGTNWTEIMPLTGFNRQWGTHQTLSIAKPGYYKGYQMYFASAGSGEYGVTEIGNIYLHATYEARI